MYCRNLPGRMIKKFRFVIGQKTCPWSKLAGILTSRSLCVSPVAWGGGEALGDTELGHDNFLGKRDVAIPSTFHMLYVGMWWFMNGCVCVVDPEIRDD